MDTNFVDLCIDLFWLICLNNLLITWLINWLVLIDGVALINSFIFNDYVLIYWFVCFVWLTIYWFEGQLTGPCMQVHVHTRYISKQNEKGGNSCSISQHHTPITALDHSIINRDWDMPYFLWFSGSDYFSQYSILINKKSIYGQVGRMICRLGVTQL